MTEGKTENRKGKEGLPQMGPAHRGSPAQGQGRLLPRARQAAAAVASMPSPLDTSFFPPRPRKRVQKRPGVVLIHFPLFSASLPSSLARFIAAREARRSTVEPPRSH